MHKPRKRTGDKLAGVPNHAYHAAIVSYQQMRPLRIHLLPAVFLALATSIASAQTYTISTFAGGALPVNMPGTSASLATEPQYVVADAAGNIYFVDQNSVLRLDATTAILTRVAGNGLSQTITNPTVTIGGVPARVLLSGLAPESVGEYQVDALVPASSSKGCRGPSLDRHRRRHIEHCHYRSAVN
jgi:hypothetical protein